MSSDTDAYLTALVNAYNRFFGGPLDAFGQRAWQDFWQLYDEQPPFKGGVKNGWILLPISAKEKENT